MTDKYTDSIETIKIDQSCKCSCDCGIKLITPQSLKRQRCIDCFIGNCKGLGLLKKNIDIQKSGQYEIK